MEFNFDVILKIKSIGIQIDENTISAKAILLSMDKNTEHSQDLFINFKPSEDLINKLKEEIKNSFLTNKK